MGGYNKFQYILFGAIMSNYDEVEVQTEYIHMRGRLHDAFLEESHILLHPVLGGLEMVIEGCPGHLLHTMDCPIVCGLAGTRGGGAHVNTGINTALDAALDIS